MINLYKLKIFNLKNLIIILLFITGTYLSLKTGISHDEFHEEKNWEVNYHLIKSLGSKDFKKNYETLKNYKDKYHGIGFQYISYIFQNFIIDKINFFDIENEGLIYLSKHPIIFTFYLISAFYFIKILKLVIQNKLFIYLSFCVYLFYPYLVGHALINLKDIPFLSVWLALSYYTYIFLKSFFIFEKFNKKYFFILTILAAYLFSIRLSGILFFVQFIITIFFFINYKKKYFKIFLKNIKYILLGLFTFLLLIWLLIPLSWLNIFEILNGIQYLSKFPHNPTTLTAGEYVRALDVPIDYIFKWLIVKLPTISFFGFVTYFFIWNKIEENLDAKIITQSFLLTFFSIYFLLFIKSANIYDEIRHLLFLVPLLLVSSLIYFFFFNKKVCNFVLALSVLIFILDSIKIFPYQYTWFNIPSRLVNLTSNYEIDYWETANRELSLYLSNKYSNYNNRCVYGGQYDYIFLKKRGFECFKNFTELKDDNIPKFILQYGRNLRNTSKITKSCNQVYEKSYKLLFTNENLKIGKIFICN